MLISLLHGTPEPVTASTLHVTSIQSHVKSARRSADLLTERLKYEVCSAMELPAAGDSLLIVVACEYRQYVLPLGPAAGSAGWPNHCCSISCCLQCVAHDATHHHHYDVLLDSEEKDGTILMIRVRNKLINEQSAQRDANTARWLQ